MAELKQLDPVQGLVDYVLDIKPYHTKIVEVLVEYIYNEPVDVTISDEHDLDVVIQNPPGYFKDINTDPNLPPNWVLIPGSLLDPDVIFKFECDNGFDATGFGAGQLSITSPNLSISFSAYPAINSFTNSFILADNVVSDIKVGDQLRITSRIEDTAVLYSIYSANVGAAGSASFVVIGDATADFILGFAFNATGAGVNNGTYTTISSSFDGTYTTILVDQSIADPSSGGNIGIVITSGVHTGLYTVSAVTFDGGSIDFRTNPTDPLTLSLGNNPHTIVTVVEPLVAIPSLGPTETYSAIVLLDPIEVELSLSYSRSEKIYDSGTNTITQIPNEGTNQQDILGITLSTVILGIPVPDSGKVVLGGDFRTSNIFVGDALRITQSTGNNGTYTIASITYNTGPDNTTFGVDELIDDPTVDGFGIILVPSNVFFVNDDRTSQFTQGRRFDLFGGSFEGTYTILRSDFSQGKTRVRTAETIFDIGEGSTIIGTVGGFNVPGNQTTKYTAGTTFNAIGSPQNDGPYTVDVGGATFDVLTGLSTIPVTDTLDSTPGGELHLTVYGELRQHKFGYDELSPMCGLVPDTIVSVYFNELLKFTGLGLELSDDLIAYNLENTDPGGFEYPLMTIVSTTTPPVPAQLSAPGSPAIKDLWYDTTNTIFRQWNGYEWDLIKTANWFDTSVNMLYYRTIGLGGDLTGSSAQVDTGWILDSIRFPGFSDFIPAVGETRKIHRQLFTSVAISPGVADPTFVISIPVPGSDSTLLKVTINGMHAGFTLNSSTTFTITSPPLTIGDIVIAEVYDRAATQTNAHVTPYDVQPYLNLHRTVTVDTTNDAYIVAGGNFVERFVTFNKFTVFDTTAPVANLGIQNAMSLPIIDVDDLAGTITVEGNYGWLFTTNRIFRVNPSDRNYNDFEVQSVDTATIPGSTIITVTPSPFESDNDPTDNTQQYFYNPPLPTINIDNVAEMIVLPGKVFEAFPAGLEVLVENSTIGNNLVWTVASASYDSINDRTNVIVTGDIPDPDSSGNATVRIPIFQNYSKDLGVIIGAVYEPAPGLSPDDLSAVPPYDTGQPKTIIVPVTTDPAGIIPPVREVLSPTANMIEYMWVGPVRFDISQRRTDILGTAIGDQLQLADELTGGVISTAIVYTTRLNAATPNTFEIYFEATPGNPSDLTNFFVPGTIFGVDGSYSDGLSAGNIESNDAIYIVKTSVWDNALDWDNGNINGSKISTDPSSFAGRTIITVETDYSKIPPYSPFTITAALNNVAPTDPSLPVGPNPPAIITLAGDVEQLFSQLFVPVFALDVATAPIIDTDPLLNVATVTNAYFNGTDTELSIDETIISEIQIADPDVPTEIIEAKYRGNIYYDESDNSIPPAPPWTHGRVFIHGGEAATLTAATITDDLMFGWGDVLRWNIVNMNQANSTVDLHGDFSAVIFPNDPVTIVGSQNIDGSYDAVSVSYNNPTNISTVTLANPVIANTPASADINVTILNVDNTGPNYFDIDGGDGTHIDFLRPTLTFDVVNSLANDGTYTIVTAVDLGSNILRVTVIEVPPALDASGDVKYTKLLAGKLEMDGVDITPWFQYNIIELQYGASNLIISGDVTVDVFSGQQIRILGTDSNNGAVKVTSAPIYDSSTNTSTVTVGDRITSAPIVLPGSNPVVLLPSNITIKVLGTAAMFLQGNDIITVVNSFGNDGAYIVQNVTFDGVYSFITITTTFPDATPDGDVQFNERGGWIESWRYQGIALRFDDMLQATITESVDGALVLTAGSMLSAWDYNYFDVGSFDENLSTVIRLYSSTL